jgi:serine/threonine-protein kinase
VLALSIGGDPLARALFWCGIGILGLCNVWLLWLTGKRERYTPRAVATVWAISSVGICPSFFYFGPFSAVVIAPMLGVVFIAMGRDRTTSLVVSGILLVGHLALAVPIAFGVLTDRGVLPSFLTSRVQLLLAEGLIVTFLISAYLLGRWARSTNKAALDELASAVRVIGDQQQQLAEVDAEAARARRAKEGRWTQHMMGEFRLGLVLGRGAMGEVYEAVGPDDEAAAVKLLSARSVDSSSLVERFHREMAVAARLESPNIVKVLALSAPDAPVPFIAMERLMGTDLAAMLRTKHRLAPDELVVLIDQVARGLEVARLAGVVHRDLKPHNLFFHAETTWKILDFGVSKLMDSEGTLTGEGIVGTPQYMAPEQASGGQVTHLADVYALGAIAYRCLTARSPFKGKDLAELVYQVVHQAPPRPSSLGRVSAELDDVIAIAMAKDPRKRFPSALAFAQAFFAARRGKPCSMPVPADAWATAPT